jgi:acetyl-CoA carboxylase biotin carboxyl carrier protein
MASKKRQTSPTGSRKGNGSTSNSGPDLAVFKQLVELMAGTDVMHFRWRRGEEEWEMKRGPMAVGPLKASETLTEASESKSLPIESGKASPSEPGDASLQGGHFITSPFVGTFYRTPAPEKPPFVELGSLVRKGQTLCIVEAMKLMNEIEADVEGRVVEILAESGQPVEFGQALFRILPA